MNLTEFAEQIVFGKTLEDKLIVPGRLKPDGKVTNRPNVESLAAPGRIAGLEMRYQRGGNAQPPSDDGLENEKERGKLLHFLANHELLATELMALVLLKFPDAPHAFRQGILVTLQEEQEHTRMYIRRMKECGVEFGDFPLSGYFWRAIEPMKSPMDFVSRLSLTFEQANLDYSLHFAKVFKKIGDDETSKLLTQIYEDEIGHVQHGLHWFRQWKDQERTDWEAYQDSLEYPMSPQRARGPRAAFNRDGRVQAGLSDDFINAIEVFRQSRGRPPTVRWFSPDAESELAGETAEQSQKSARIMGQLGRDLELTMVAMAKQDDIVLVREIPSMDLRRHWADVGLQLPEFVRLEERETLSARSLHDFAPWAWTPDSHVIAKPLLSVTKHPPEPWKDCDAELFRKSWSAERLGQWLGNGKTPDWFADLGCVGNPVNDVEEVKVELTRLAAEGYSTAIFKLDLGASGRGQRRLDCRNLNEKDEEWLTWVFKSQNTEKDGPVAIVEPQLDRLIDLSFLWHVPQGGTADFLGWTRPMVAEGRRYKGTRLVTPFGDCDSEMKRFLLPDRCARLQAVADWLQERVAAELVGRGFAGYFGVDAFVYRSRCGGLKIKPVVELNPRMTMGHLALGLERKISSGVASEFRIFTMSEWKEVRSDLENVPLTYSGDNRWKSGVIRFSEVDEKTKLVPVLKVGC